jgi:toxin-antitoxin system PIN domain toxin
MTAIDTNILFAAVIQQSPQHQKAHHFLQQHEANEDFAVSEFALLELYVLLRNQAVVEKPLTSAKAAEICQSFRFHPQWVTIGFPGESRVFHDLFWKKIHSQQIARRRAYDIRMALTLTAQGVSQFATVNAKDFADLGFKKVWNPLE